MHLYKMLYLSRAYLREVIWVLEHSPSTVLYQITNLLYNLNKCCIQLVDFTYTVLIE
jgi:hypothetical protein